MEGIQFLAAAIVAGLAAIGAGLGFGMMGEHVEQDSQKLERMLTLNNILLSKL